MKYVLLFLTAALSLAACSPITLAPVSASAVSTVLADSQLFCQVGPVVVAMAQATGASVAPILAKGASSAYVRAACAVVSGLAVSPPASAGSAPVLVIPAFSVPLRT